ncbi:MAG: UDP-N-acetylmuramate dehydrogenase [Actinomycetota bacterium]|nr:UDP-N-acetylmuramate dehydrogenase [Actinomycetota bacterium]
MTGVDPEVFAAIDAHLVGVVRTEVPLGPLTTYRVGGPARRFATVESDADLGRVADVVARTGVDVVVVGKGSNLLVADAGFDGLALVLGAAFADVGVSGTTVRAGGAAALPVVARRTVAAGLTGFEWAVGVPGSIGGAVRMNAGGHGSDMAASLARVRVVDLAGGEDEVVTAADLELEYRSSTLAPHHVVAWAELELEPGDRPSAEEEVAAIVRWRRANQPGGQNAGSVFTNPPGRSAGRLVDAAGLKGLRIGSAQVSPKHANFIQADEGGSADDVWALTAEVRRRVHVHSGVVLSAETRTLGLAPLAELAP